MNLRGICLTYEICISGDWIRRHMVQRFPMKFFVPNGAGIPKIFGEQRVDANSLHQRETGI